MNLLLHLQLLPKKIPEKGIFLLVLSAAFVTTMASMGGQLLVQILPTMSAALSGVVIWSTAESQQPLRHATALKSFLHNSSRMQILCL